MAFSFKKRAGKQTDVKIRGERVPPKGKVFKAASGVRFVLFIGDEGAILVHLKNNTVLSRQFVPDASQQHLDELKQTFAKNPKAPVLVVVDNMDQSYVQQTLPPVSAMSVGKLIKRRLDRDFGGNDIKGAVLLGREKTGRKDWNFLMIALESSPQLTVWLDFVMELPNRFSGIRLVSVESELLLKTLERSIGVPKEGTGSEWKFFVSHNKVGGFRQVILRNGRIIFTRLAQPLAEANAEVIAGSIEQEMLSTIEYMKRLSYNPQSGLDIYIVASSGIKEAIDTTKFHATSCQIYTPFEIAGFFGIEGATQPTDQFGDVILAAILGSSRKSVLTLPVPQYRKIDLCYKLTLMQRVLLVAGSASLLVYSAYMGYGIFTLGSEIERLERQKNTEQNTLTSLRSEIARTNLDVEKSTDMIDLYKQLQQENVNPTAFIEMVRPLIVAPIGLKAIEWSLVDPSADKNNPQPDPMRAMVKDPNAKWMTATLTLELPAIAADPKARRIIMNKVISDFSTALKGFSVTQEKGTAETDQSGQQYKLSSESQAMPIQPVIDPTKLVEERIIIQGPLPGSAKEEEGKKREGRP